MMNVINVDADLTTYVACSEQSSQRATKRTAVRTVLNY